MPKCGSLVCGIVATTLLAAIEPSFSFMIQTTRKHIKRPISNKLKSADQFLTSRCPSQRQLSVIRSTEFDEVDVIVIGSGIGGLSAAALSAKYGMETICVEAHDTPGGVAHSFDRYSKASKDIPFRFDSGPSLISGLSSKGTNPLRQVLDAIGTADSIEWVTYDGWIVHDYADGKSFRVTTGNTDAFAKALGQKAGEGARTDFEHFRDKILEKRGLAEASAYIPPFALRGGLGSVASLSRYMLKLLSIGTKGAMLTGPFSEVMDKYNVKDPFVRKWFDYLSFALSGLDASQTQAAAVAYMMMDLHKEGAVLDYPKGGMESLIQALVQGLENHGGSLLLNSRVEKILLDDVGHGPACYGVMLDDGKVIKARKGVISNAPVWNLAKILKDSADDQVPDSVRRAVDELQAESDNMQMTDSFMHLHLGIPKDGLPDDLECHHSVLDFSQDVTAEQNMVIISIPTVFDPSLAPEGYHIVHAYSAACDSFNPWEKYLDGGKETGKVGTSPNSIQSTTYRKNGEYEALKEVKSEILWKAVEKVIPDVRKRAKKKGSVVLVGTPLTHRRYNQRYRGTYGPAPGPGESVWKLRGATTNIKKLLACGDTCFPGIGLPGVAASGTIAANTLTTIKAQADLMKDLRSNGSLQ